MIDLSDIQRVRSQFSMDGEGWFWSSEFLYLLSDLYLASVVRKDELLRQSYLKHQYVTQDLSNIGTVLFRLEWIRSQAETSDSLKALWFQFATVDIQYFHTELRSIFDYVAQIIKETGNKPGQIPDSFRELQQWLNKNPGNRARLGEELAKVVESVDWFPDVQRLRDSIIHSGAFTLVFLNPEEGILFQTYANSVKPFIADEVVMYNRNVIDFQLYSALYLCRLFLLLDELAKIVRSKLNIKNRDSQASSRWLGIEIIIQWIDKLTEKIKM